MRGLRAYLDDALEQIRTTALFSSSVDWDEVGREAQAVLGTATCYADTHAFLTATLRKAGGLHSHLTPPRTAAASRQRDTRLAAALGPLTPTGHVIGQGPDAVAYLRLPRLSEGRRAASRYLAAGADVMSSLMSAGASGWIVDLRADIGGGVWPMLAVAAPLLPDGVLGHFLLTDGRVQTWSARSGRIKLDRRTMARSRTRLPRRTRRTAEERTPIAVLTSRHTASAGEAVALAFRAQPRALLIGGPTAGMTTGNRTHVLRDETRLRISSARYADHDQTPVEGPVPIDRHLPDNSREIALSTALAWLRGRGWPSDAGDG